MPDGEHVPHREGQADRRKVPLDNAPPVVVQATPVKSEPAPPPPPLSPPSRPLLTLVGAIASDTDSIAIFMDETTKAIVRMKVGESHSGWKLRSVAKRQATLEMARQIAVLVIPIP